VNAESPLFFYSSLSNEVPGEQGCFTSKKWKKGEILEYIPLQQVLGNIIHIDEFMAHSENQSAKYGYRYSGDLVHYSAEKRLVTDYINHSQNPNVLIYMGITIAIRDISVNEELLADYRFLMHEKFTMDCGEYCVSGLKAQEADREFSRMLAELLSNASG
jgi:SET domain-containing protein